MKIELSNRLKIITDSVYPYRNIIDVGTDHALVPIFLLKENKIDNAIATDLNCGPLDEAKKNISLYNLDDKVDLRLGNGLSIINENDNCDVIIIAGMGGKLITEILESGKHILHLNKRLILQPNLNEESVRRWLRDNQYLISKEEIIKEDNIYYEIIVSNKTNTIIEYSDLDIKFGPHLLRNQELLFFEKWTNILKHKKDIYQKIPNNHPNKKIFEEEIKLIEKVIKKSS